MEKNKMSIVSNIHFFGREVYSLVKSPVFIMLTILGNGLIGISGAIFYYLEKDENQRLDYFIDAIWWAFSTATTTGYGDITPVTGYGKILGILLMLMGTALFAMYTGLFAEIILTNSRRKN